MSRSIFTPHISTTPATYHPFSPLLRGARTPEFNRNIPFRKACVSSLKGAAELAALAAFAGILCCAILTAATAFGA
ncbi:hypothetical protein GCM10019059_40900 [Camelimonas fluminis]|uniref:Uncharacterized protein n=1 Tax=Camelimonas fluminis TaxID=1576911 RepID=A0ABV7UBN1_9HYPH|nr:hypothetical protein [Camelimonas fluminis]GHE77731.1 hypothetical protein GCM10019059_40900 [Camelimonas fluminis]